MTVLTKHYVTFPVTVNGQRDQRETYDKQFEVMLTDDPNVVLASSVDMLLTLPIADILEAVERLKKDENEADDQ